MVDIRFARLRSVLPKSVSSSPLVKSFSLSSPPEEEAVDGLEVEGLEVGGWGKTIALVPLETVNGGYEEIASES